MTRVVPFLTFQPGREQSAAAAMEAYVALFPGGRVISDQRHGPDGPGAEGTVLVAEIEVAGHRLRCSDSVVDHAWDFTPATSLWVELGDETEQQRVFEGLADGGRVHMPLDDYGFGRFGWVDDRFGVSWQLALA